MPNIFTDTTPVVDPSDPNSPTCVITDAWGLVYAQGGVVMAAALRAIETVLDRPDLTLASASATFCRPVACGPVTTEVEVLRSGRRGAQVHATLRDQHSTDGGANVVLTAVFTDPELEGPRSSPLERPVELSEPPGDAVESAVPADDRFELGFLDNTVWHLAASPAHADAPVVAGSPVPRLALWFRFTDPPAPPVPVRAASFRFGQLPTAILFVTFLVGSSGEGTCGDDGAGSRWRSQWWQA